MPEIPDSLRPIATEGVPLWPLTTMRIGGLARWLVNPETEGDLQEATVWARSHRLSFMVLGSGSNVVFSDDGFPGVVILTHGLRGIEVSGESVTASCGENLTELSRRMSRIGLSGLEWACGIPGTIGGAIAGNAGAHGSDIGSVLSHVRLLTANEVHTLPAVALKLGYRTSALRDGEIDGIVLGAIFSLRRDSPARCVERERAVLQQRYRTQPVGATSGCIFKNPPHGATAGELLDRAGCKGMRVGRAAVSDVHANFIVNEGEDNAADVLGLIERMKRRVLDAHGIDLELEIITIGDCPPSQ